jgi:hypothetical protein
MRQRTQNPPPSKACRFDSDLGHHLHPRVMRGRWAEVRRCSIRSEMADRSAESSQPFMPSGGTGIARSEAASGGDRRIVSYYVSDLAQDASALCSAAKVRGHL